MRIEKLKFGGLCLVLVLSINSIALGQRSFTYMPYKMVVGDLKGMAGTYKGYEMLINQASPDYPFNLILEKGVSFCYFINQYISNRDTTCLSLLTINSSDERSFYKHLQKLNKDRLFINRIIVRPIDLENSENFKTALNAAYYMIKKVSNDYYQKIADSIYNDNNAVNRIKVKDLLNLIDTTRMSYLMSDDSILIQIKHNLSQTTELGTPYSEEWFTKREKILLYNYQKTTSSLNRFCLITDVTHMPASKNKKAFLKYAELKEFGVDCYYPIYFNHYTNTTYSKTFYCMHSKNPFKWNSKLYQQFNLKKGAWLMSTSKANYIIISN